jgi:uncharacterized delta-60 repeat protein
MIRPRPSDRPRRHTRLRPTLDRLEGRALMAFAGSLDPTFGTGGVYSAPITLGASTGLSSVGSVAVEPDGSVLEAGVVGQSGATYGVIHLTAAGKLDTSFGNAGELDLALPSPTDTIPGLSPGSIPIIPVTLLVQPDGKFILEGLFSTSASATSSTIIARFDEDGTPDTTFGTDGQVVLGPAGTAIDGATFEYGALQSNGQIILAGSAPSPQGAGDGTVVAVARLDANGQLDTTYGTDGLVTLASPTKATIPATMEGASSVTVAPNGQVVVVDSVNYQLSGAAYPSAASAIFRLNSDGTQDTTLSQSGLLASGLNSPSAYGVAVQPDGKILVSGVNIQGLEATNVLVRLNVDGTIDDQPTLPPQVSFLGQGDIGLEANGDVVFTNLGGYKLGYLTTVRLTPNLTLDPTFGQGGISTVPLPVPPPFLSGTEKYIGAATFAITPSGQIVVGGINYDEPESGSVIPQSNVVARLTGTTTGATTGDFTGDGVSDPAIYNTTTATFTINSAGDFTQTVALGTAGLGNSIPAPGNYYGTGQQDLAVYLPASATFAIQDPTGKTAGEYVPFGIAGPGQTIPAPGDYFGTGQDDVAGYFPAYGVYDIQDPSGKTPGVALFFGTPGVGQSIPVPGDYYGTGQSDIAVYLAQSGVWAILAPSLASGEYVQFGIPGIGNTIPVPGDYDGSGKTELAVYLPGLAELAYLPAAGGPPVVIPFGLPGAGQTLPEPGDYDGSGKTEVAAYFPSSGIFAYRPANGGADVYEQIGTPGSATLAVTPVATSLFLGGVSAESYEGPSVMGEADELDFVMPLASAKKKTTPGGEVG